MSRSDRRQRGYTLSELMVVTIILGLVMSAVVVFVGPLLRSHMQSQVKVDTIQSAASGLYELQRDLRQTSFSQVFVCTTGSTPSCSAAGTTFDTTKNAIVFPTAYQNGRGQFQLNPNVGPDESTPYWQGVMVYWVDSTGQMKWASDKPLGFNVGKENLSAAIAAIAIADVLAAGGTTVANNVQQLLAAKPGTNNIISLRMQAQSSISGATNETTFQSDVLARK